MNRKIFFLSFLILFTGWNLRAQDPQFSQFYAAPLYHNPAFTGTGFAPRMILNYRNQWPGLEANFTTSMLSIDNHFDRINSGFGLAVLKDNSGNLLSSLDASLLYSYQFQVADEGFIRLGLQGTWSNKYLKSNSYIFGDQFIDLNTINPNTIDPLGNTGGQVRISKAMDFSSGLLYYSPRGYFGLALHHMNKPKFQTFSGSLSELPMKITLDAGINIPLSSPFTSTYLSRNQLMLTPALLFRKQGSFSQMDAGAYLSYTSLTAGLWYRGIPIKKHETSVLNSDAMVILLGYRLDNFSIGYSYDLTVSKLGPSTGGAHELSFSYQFENFEKGSPNKKRRDRQISCPKF